MAALDETEGLHHHFPNEEAHSRREKEGARQAVWMEGWIKRKRIGTTLQLPSTNCCPKFVYLSVNKFSCGTLKL